jgi:Uma2 family endonuclease
VYAAAAVPEYWIVDVDGRRVEVYRDPNVEAGRYRSSLTLEGEAVLRSSSVPELVVHLAALFG